VWVDWWRSVAYDDVDGGFTLGSPTLLDGGQMHTLPAPLDQIPLLVKAGSIVPLLSPDVDTLAEHGTDPAIVHLSDRADRLHLLAFPRGTTTSRFYESESLTSVEGATEWRLTLAGAREYAVTLEAALGTLAAPFVPCAVDLSDGVLDGWTYDAGTRVLVASFRSTSGTLTVRAACGP
jgi:hypothetical protein